MEKEFVPYKQALALKELGFNEKCFLYYGENNILRVFTIDIKDLITNSELPPQYNTCPTFSQAFRWFREKYKLSGLIDIGRHDYSFYILDETKDSRFPTSIFDGTYQEARQACLEKLIEIVENEK